MDDAVEQFLAWAAEHGYELYPHQEEALLEVASGAHVIVDTPTGSGKSLIGLAAHMTALADGRRSYYTAPIKALVSEKFFELTAALGSERVGMVTGDASVNPTAPVICCTAEILANLALREGADADAGLVVMDEFHYFADPDRGWAWQVPLLELTATQFVLMSATLGDVSRFTEDLPRRTGRPVAHVRSAIRPVPLIHEYRVQTITELVDELLATHQTPAYLVHFTQAGAVERAQSLLSVNLLDRDEKDQVADLLGGFRFSPGFGKTLSRFVRHGVGVHHAGMLPRYRRLVERLAQAGLLKVICGTDTLGVGINVPIRTVVLTSLSKYDGTSTRLLSAREFHQIGGRAGRAGFDPVGTVIVLAPEHAIENARAEAKIAARTAADGPNSKKVRKVVKKKPPPGMVSWGEPTFARLVAAAPEPLTSSFTVSHAMVLDVLDRPGDGRAALEHLLTDNYEPPARQVEHVAHAAALEHALLDAGALELLDEPDDLGRRVRVTIDLQETFALNQPLAPFAMAALDLLDPDAPDHALDVVSVIEAVLEDPRPVIAAQLKRARGEAVASMKAAGMDYDERMAELDRITHPRPLADVLEPGFELYRQRHPWVSEHPLRPKSVARDLWERAMDFGDYVRHYELARSEGVVLRYLAAVYKALGRTIPPTEQTDELTDLTVWLGELVRQVDSSLLEEWEALRSGADAPVPTPEPLDRTPPKLTSNRRAFTVLVRNALFQRVELIARRAWHELEVLEAEHGDSEWSTTRWFEAMAPYFEEHETLGIGADARSSALVLLDDLPADGVGRWRVVQILDDPEGHHEWRIVATVDLEASDQLGAAVVRVDEVGPGAGTG
jgi:superfamily II RNA helicase